MKLLLLIIIWSTTIMLHIPKNVFCSTIYGNEYQTTTRNYILSAEQTSRFIRKLFQLYEQEDQVRHGFPSSFYTIKEHQRWFDTPRLEYTSKFFFLSTSNRLAPKNTNTPGTAILSRSSSNLKSNSTKIEFRLGANTRIVSSIDKHELFGKIHHLSQQAFWEALPAYKDISPLSIKSVLEGMTTSIVFQVKKKNKVYSTISINKVITKSMGFENVFSILTFESNDTFAAGLNKNQQNELAKRIATLESKLIAKENLGESYPTKFQLMWPLLISSHPFLLPMIQAPFPFQLLQLLGIIVIGSLIIFFINIFRQLAFNSGSIKYP